jgi:hypothetical protein
MKKRSIYLELAISRVLAQQFFNLKQILAMD